MTRPVLLVSDRRNNVFDVPRLEAAGMKGEEFFRLEPASLVKLPRDSELFMLPARIPVGFDPGKKRPVRLEGYFPVAAFLAPGYTGLFNAAYTEEKGAKLLPLFSYTAVAFYRGSFYVPAVKIDAEKRQALSGMSIAGIKKGVKLFRKLFPKNRLARHLESCALEYGCPAARNLFLKRYEAPLPTSPGCNADCIGCISYRPAGDCPPTQPRIRFVPSPEEVAEIAVYHLNEVRDPVVSFGQGCEGEPLTAVPVLEKAVALIRASTSRGIINLNTNASRPGTVRKLFDAGLDSMRVSINSAREIYYNKYYRPLDYSFNDVLTSIKNAKTVAGSFVSINYLVMPGFTDDRREVGVFFSFLEKTGADMVQWRNLNYDPLDYFRRLKPEISRDGLIGIDVLIEKTKKKFPSLMQGYFNPSRERIKKEKGFAG